MWRGSDIPAGLNQLAVQFLMVLKAGGEELLKLVEEPALITLAESLLETDDDGSWGRGTHFEGSLVIEACGMGDTLALDDFQTGTANEEGKHNGQSYTRSSTTIAHTIMKSLAISMQTRSVVL